MHDEFYAYQMLTSTRSATGKLTGYFEPLISGSLQQQGAYKYPIYGIPKDMYMVDSRTVAGQSSRWLKIPGSIATRKLFTRLPATSWITPSSIPPATVP